MATLNHGTHVLDGVVYHAETPAWEGWTREACATDGCDFAIYRSPTGEVYDGYIPTEDHPANCKTPADITQSPYKPLPSKAKKTGL